ncbi:hypothetical protein ACRTDU_20465 [Sunxiuqinia elliptica]
MKTKKGLFTILAALAVTLTMAGEKPKISVRPLGADRLLMTIVTPEASEMEVTIDDHSGNFVYYGYWDSPEQTFKKIFDMKNLANGKYAMKLEVDGLTSEQELTVSHNKLSVNNTKEFVPACFQSDNKHLTLTYENMENQKCDLEIYGKNGLVHQASFRPAGQIYAHYDISKLEEGNYTVYLDSANENFEFTFEKE